jgi:aromatic ring-opening dioxygenase catalytic subunit (LigB family)
VAIRHRQSAVDGTCVHLRDLVRSDPARWHDRMMFATRDKWRSDDMVDADALAADPAPRTELLRAWEQAPSARVAHPTEDHLIPLMVAVGAAEEEPAVRVYHETTLAGSLTASSFSFGRAA